MAKQTINLGTGDSTGDGESVRSAFDKCNDNFSELYTTTASNTSSISTNATAIATKATLGDLSVTTASASGAGSLAYNSSTGVFTFTPAASVPETNDLSAAVTWANIPDAYVPASAVTQHQAAIRITESQITDLGHTTEVNDLTSSVTWANVPDANITQSSVTQHQAALSITESQISDLQTYLTSETTTSLALASNTLTFTDETGTATNIDLSPYLDEDSRSIASGTLNAGTGIVTFTRDDASTFTLDLSALLDDGPVASVAGRTGVVTLDTDDVSEGTNLYYTDARAQAVSINNVVEDTTPQLGGNLDLNSSNITGTGDISITGIATFTDSATGEIIVHETDNDTAGRLIALSGTVYLQAGAQGSGKATSAGNLRFAGYNNQNLNSLQAKFGGTFVDVATVSTAQTFTNKSGNISQWTNDSGYLTSVSEAAVTAHEAALSITESQISDLGTYLTAVPGDTTVDTLTVNDGIKEKLQSKSITSSGTFTFQCASGQVFYVSSPAANWTANFTDLTIDTNYATTATIVIVQGATAYLPTAIAIAGSGATINWQGGSAPTGTNNGIDVVTFSFLNVGGTYTVLGQLTDF